MNRSAFFLNVAMTKQTIPGNYDVFSHALTLLPDFISGGDYESSPAIVALCSWWNANSPETMRTAGLFRTYIWDPYECAFRPGDHDEPWLTVERLIKIPCYAIFRKKGRPPVAVVFCRGRAFNEEDGKGNTVTFFANGDPDLRIGMGINEADPAFYTMRGLIALDSTELRWRKVGEIPWPENE